MFDKLPFRSVIFGDTEFEFGGVNGNPLRPVCAVFKDLTSGQEWRLRRGEFGAVPPFSTGPDTLFVAYYASAEIGFFHALGWPAPARILDLFTEFRNLTNGLPVESNKLIHALEYFGLDTIGAHYKQQMIDLILRGPPWTEEEWQAILDYCAGDVYALERLLPAMLPFIDLPRALFRGRYMGNLGVVENYGVPIDIPTITLVQKHWTNIQDELIAEIDADYGVYDGRTFKEERFEAYLERNNVPWPRLESGRLDLDDSKRHTFREMAKIYPSISPLRELRHALSTMRLFSDLTIGEDGRNRTILSAFGSKTGRNQPSNAKFIFGTSTWIRGFIKPPPGHGVAYIDWTSQEVGIAAALSGDKNLMADAAGDPYIRFGIRAGLLPVGATKTSAEETHPGVRDMIKACVLGVQYGMGQETLAFRIGKSTITSRGLIRAHEDQYQDFWKMADSAVACAMQGQPISTVFGFNVRAGPQARWRSLMNFPIQANGAEMMRLACCMAVERGIEVCAPVHDAFLICAPLDQLDARVAEMKFVMEEASRIVLDGFTIKADCPEFDDSGKLLEFPQIVRYPNRYMIKRGVKMWNTVMEILERLEGKKREIA